MRRPPFLFGSILSVGLASGCASTPKPPEVRDEWVARVPPEQMGPVNDARTSLRMTNDEAVRTGVALQDAKRQVEVH
jgi:colicin import membrane protein